MALNYAPAHEDLGQGRRHAFGSAEGSSLVWGQVHVVRPLAAAITTWVDASIDHGEGTELIRHNLGSLMVAAAHRLFGITLGWLLTICSPGSSCCGARPVEGCEAFGRGGYPCHLSTRRARIMSKRGGDDMPTAITRDEVRALLARGAQLVDVLPAEEYAEQHVPGAISIPLRS